VYKNKLYFRKQQLGDNPPSALVPTTYITISRKFVSGDYNFISIPAINMQTDFKALPSFNIDFMCYYKKRVGLGVNYRIHDAVSAILQVRIWKNLIIGLAYDYTISRFRAAGANSDEQMIGFSPVMSTEDLSKAGTHDCPKFEF